MSGVLEEMSATLLRIEALLDGGSKVTHPLDLDEAARARNRVIHRKVDEFMRQEEGRRGRLSSVIRYLVSAKVFHAVDSDIPTAGITKEILSLPGPESFREGSKRSATYEKWLRGSS